MKLRIIQIIPAGGDWFSVWHNKAEDGSVEKWYQPVACWALVQEASEDETLRWVTGIDPDIYGTLHCDAGTSFGGYIHARGLPADAEIIWTMSKD